MTTDGEVMLTPGRVAQLLGVDTKTIARWADAGKIKYITTPGGHRRYPKSEVDRFFSENY